MADVPVQTASSELQYTEFNNLTEGLRNLINTTSQTASSGDTNQYAKSAAEYAASGWFYTDSGAANAYVLTNIGTLKSPNAYVVGELICFRAANANTGASTVNVATKGVKNIKKADGSTDPAAGDISTTADAWARYDGTSFRLIAFGAGGSVAAGDPTVSVSSDDTTLGDLEAKIVAGTGISLATLNPAGNEQLEITSTATAGNIVQIVNVQDGAVATGTTTVPFDDTIPQNTEGTEFMTLAITPTSASNILRIDVVTQVAATAGGPAMTSALFQDSTAGALASVGEYSGAGNELRNISFTHYMTSGTASSTTFKVRCGFSSASTVTFNGVSSARRYGGVSASSITITEIQV